MSNQNYKEYLVFRDTEYSKNDYDSMYRLGVCLNWHYPTQPWYFTAHEENNEVMLLIKSDQEVTLKKLRTFKEIADHISDDSICYIKRVIDAQIETMCEDAELIDCHDGTGDLHGELITPDMYLRIDDYYISVNNMYMSICIDGQNIIHQRLKPNDTQSRARLAHVAIEAINGYNYTHDLEWNKIK